MWDYDLVGAPIILNNDNDLDAVIANIKEQIHDSNFPRARIVCKDGTVRVLKDYNELCEAIESTILLS